MEELLLPGEIPEGGEASIEEEAPNRQRTYLVIVGESGGVWELVERCVFARHPGRGGKGASDNVQIGGQHLFSRTFGGRGTCGLGPG